MTTENPNPNINTNLLVGFERMFAQWERERLIERMRLGKQRKADAARLKGGKP